MSDFTFTFHFHALKKEMATHSSVLAWRIPGTGEPGGLPSMGLHRVGHDWSNLAAAATEPSCISCLMAPSFIFRFSHHSDLTYASGSIMGLPQMGFPGGSDGKESPCNAGDWGSALSWEDPLGKEIATPCSILAWKSQGQRILLATVHGLAKVRHNWVTNTP